MNNNSYVYIAGAAVASLAAGAAGGYLFAKRRFDAVLGNAIKVEVTACAEHYVTKLKSRDAEIDSLRRIMLNGPVKTEVVEEPEIEEDEPLSPADQKVVDNGAKALVNYQGMADKPPLDQVVSSNIFSAKTTDKRPYPPRDPETGKFLQTKAKESPGVVKQVDDPYLITHEFFLGNTDEDGNDYSDYEQENLLYFIRDDTLIQVYDNEPVDVNRVGVVNLTLFPQVPKDEQSIICVRNDGLRVDYEIRLTHESLTEHMGLGDEEEDLSDHDSDSEFSDLNQ